MTTPDIEQTLTPDEAAAILDIPVQKLARWRREKRVQGTRVGMSNLYVYKLTDLRKVDRSPRRRGPKARKHVSDIVQN